MKFNKLATVKFEHGEPRLRSCWLCNPAHKRLKNTKLIHCCFACSRYWINGKYLDEFETTKKLYNFLKKCKKDKCNISEYK